MGKAELLPHSKTKRLSVASRTLKLTKIARSPTREGCLTTVVDIKLKSAREKGNDHMINKLSMFVIVIFLTACASGSQAPDQTTDQQLNCIRSTIDAAGLYVSEFLDFSHALEAWAQAEQAYMANKNDDAIVATAAEALDKLISTIEASRKTVIDTEVPTCLLSFKEEWPNFIDLMNHVIDLQESVLDMMDSIGECYERNDNACAKEIFPSKLNAVRSSMDNVTEFADCDRSPECIQAKAYQND